jgi:hypothetical protein
MKACNTGILKKIPRKAGRVFDRFLETQRFHILQKCLKSRKKALKYYRKWKKYLKLSKKMWRLGGGVILSQNPIERLHLLFKKLNAFFMGIH